MARWGLMSHTRSVAGKCCAVLTAALIVPALPVGAAPNRTPPDDVERPPSPDDAPTPEDAPETDATSPDEAWPEPTEVDEGIVPPPEPSDAVEPEPEEAAPPPSPTPRTEPDVALDSGPVLVEPRPPDGPDKLGIGLIVGGVLGVLGGVSMVGLGSFLYTEHQEGFDELSPDADPDAWGDYRQRQRARGIGVLTVGSIVAAAGLGVFTYGVVRFLRAQRRGPRNGITATAWGDANGLGLTVRGRF